MNTSAWRQLASSWTPRQSLLKVVVSERLRGTFSRLQSDLASSGCAWPLKTTILFMRRRAFYSTEHVILDAERG